MRLGRSGFEMLSLMAMAMACDLTTFVMPLIVAGLVTNHGLGEAQVGFVATAQLMSCALLSFALAPYVRKVNPRWTIALGLTLVSGGNFITLFADQAQVLIGGRLAAGVGEALVNVVVAVMVARRINPDRGFAMLAIGITAGAVAIFAIAPFLTPTIGKDGVFWLLALLPLLVTPLLAGVQTQTLNQTDPQPDRAFGVRPAAFGVTLPGLALLAGVVGFGIAGNAVFIFVERIGEGLGISYNEMVRMMLWVTVWTAIGPVIARIVGTRFGRMPVLAFAFIGLAISDPMMGAPANPTVLFVGLNLGGFCLLFASPFYQGLMVEMDPTGRLITFSRGVMAIGSAVTPSIASLMLMSGGGFPAMGYWSSVISILSLMLVYYAYLSTRRKVAIPAPIVAAAAQ